MANDPSETAPRDPDRFAAVRGSIGDRPVARLLYDLFRKGVTGCLTVIDDSADESRLYLRDGAPVHLERPNDIDRLDQVLIEAGLVAPEMLRGLSATLPPGRRLGETLVERGLISARALADVLKLQVRRKLLRLFFPRKGEFAVYLEPHPFGTGGEYGEMRIDPRCLIYPGIRAAYDEQRLEAELAPLRTLRFRLLPTLASSMLEAMGFPAHDATLKAIADRAMSLAELPAPGAMRVDSMSVVMALLYTDLLETVPIVEHRPSEAAARPAPHSPAPAPQPAPVEAARPAAPPPASREPARPTESSPRTTGTHAVVNPATSSSSHPAAGGAPPRPAGRSTGTYTIAAGIPVPPAAAAAAAEWNRPPSSTTNNATLGARITDLFEKLGTVSHFQLLGIPENAALAELGAAYLRNVRLYHPDRLPGLGLGHLTEKAARVVAQLNEAQAVLADPKRRAEYLAVRARPANSPIIDSGQSILAAERSFQTGESLLRKGDFLRAADAFAEAMRANPLEPIYKAYWAWARWDNPGPHKDRLVRETLKILDDTMKERPRFPQGLYWMGLLHKHLGDLSNAATAFRAAVGQDANLLDAERELRVIDLRKKATAAHAVPEKPGAASAARQKGGGFNKFLKR